MGPLDRAALNDSNFKKTLLVLALVFLVLMALSFRFIYGEQQSRVQLELETRASQLTSEISELIRLSVENLHAASRLVIYMRNVNYSQFNSLTEHYFEADPGLLILEWQPIVKAANRERFELTARQNGLPDFRLWEPGEDGTPVAAKPRDEHVPVYLMRSRYTEDSDINTLCLDLAWSPERMESKLHARDQGVAQSSGFFPIVLGPDDTSSPLGFAVTLPVYRSGVVPETEPARRQNLLGYLAGVYSVDLLLDRTLKEFQRDGIGVGLLDQSTQDYTPLSSAERPSTVQRIARTNLYGNTWTIQLTPSDTFVSGLQDRYLFVIPGGLTILFAVIVLFFYLEERSKIRLSMAHNKLELANRQLDALARHDGLTGLYNRRAFFDRLDQLLKELDRHPHPSCLLMLDIDWFKSINDKHGHAAGDKVLQTFASKCLETARKVDVVGRIGGEEFAILLPHTSGDAAKVFANRLKDAVAETSVRDSKTLSDITFTMSIGLSETCETIDAHTWMSQADTALYEAKSSGRNRVSEYRES